MSASVESDDAAESSASLGLERIQAQLPVTVRQLRARDIPRLGSLDLVYALNQPEVLVTGPRPARAAVASLMPWQRGKVPAFVAYSNDKLIGFARFQSLLPDGRWQLVELGAATGVYPAEPVWERLMDHAVRQAGLRGTRCLFARIPWSTPAGPALKRQGWRAYATETVFVARDLHITGRGAWRPRRQSVGDAWSIHQLYAAVTPVGVQQAEALTSQRWEHRVKQRQRGDAAGWMFEDDHQLIGFARSLSAGSRHALEFLIDPERREAAGAIIEGTLASLAPGGARNVYCVVRGYQGELATPLQERGFLAVFEQELLVRYTTAKAPRPVRAVEQFHLDILESLPYRAPTFLHGTPEDTAAP